MRYSWVEGRCKQRGGDSTLTPPEKKGSQRELYLAAKYKLGNGGRMEGSQRPWAPPPKTPRGRGHSRV
jgi:hypothetical protein